MQNKDLRKQRRHKGIRKKISGTASIPRLCVYRSNKYIYAQLIDDANSVTLVGASDIKVKKGDKTSSAKEVGIAIAKAGVAKKIEKVVFDRAGYMYHGRVKSLADGAKEGGLKF